MCDRFQTAPKESDHQAASIFWDIWLTPPPLGYGIPREHSMASWYIQTQIMQVNGLTGNLLREHAISLVDIWYVGCQGSKVVSRFLRLRPNILVLLCVALSCSGWSRLWSIMVSRLKISLYCATMRVRSKLHTIMCNTLAPSILRSDAISFAIMLLERILWPVATRSRRILLIPSPSLSMRKDSVRYGVR